MIERVFRGIFLPTLPANQVVESTRWIIAREDLSLPAVEDEVQRIRRHREPWCKPVWLECRAVTKEGLAGTYTVFVEGRSFRRRNLPGVVMRPYRVRRVRKRPPREKQLMLFSMPERSAGN